MRISALEKLTKKGIVTIQKKGERYLVECMRKDEFGFLVGRTCVWGNKLETIIEDVLKKVRKAEKGSNKNFVLGKKRGEELN